MRSITRIAPDVGWLPVSFVNVFFVGHPGGSWVLIDTGLPGRAKQIAEAAEARFGGGARPGAIILTHGHSTMSGSLQLGRMGFPMMFIDVISLSHRRRLIPALSDVVARLHSYRASCIASTRFSSRLRDCLTRSIMPAGNASYSRHSCALLSSILRSHSHRGRRSRP